MNDHEKYLFDLQGYIVLEDVLSAGELKACNNAIDARMDTIQRRSDEHLLSGGSSALKGEQGRGDTERHPGHRGVLYERPHADGRDHQQPARQNRHDDARQADGDRQRDEEDAGGTHLSSTTTNAWRIHDEQGYNTSGPCWISRG